MCLQFTTFNYYSLYWEFSIHVLYSAYNGGRILGKKEFSYLMKFGGKKTPQTQ